MSETSRTVGPNDHLTLHYRLSLVDEAVEVVSTFDGRPATLQLGCGQLAAPLEACLLGLPEGAEQRFELAPDSAYGSRHPDMIQSFSRTVFDANTDAAADGGYQPGDIVSFRGAGGEQVAGVLKAIDEQRVVMDFNHPLAGRSLAFDVRILGIL
ncbi:MAG: FKBP-type peptidyl-prolyl cis-trans isomerase [Burkholderiaceae bacterium]